MKVLSLFDGMSCGQLALSKVGYKVDKYYASEIDKYAITVTMANFPNTIQLGDVRNIKGSDLGHIDLLLGGSPCQGFSRAGKGLNFEDERSKLFFEYVRIYNELKVINPNIKFLLENVDMDKWCLGIISKYLGIFPVKINSALVSAQNRVRCYWSNIRTRNEGFWDEVHTDIPQPKDRKIFIKDITQTEGTDKYFLTDRAIDGLIRAMEREHKPTFLTDNDKAATVDTRIGAKTHRGQYIVAMRGREAILMSGEKIRQLTPTEVERLQTCPDGYTAHVSDSQRYKMLGNGWNVETIIHILKYI